MTFSIEGESNQAPKILGNIYQAIAKKRLEKGHLPQFKKSSTYEQKEAVTDAISVYVTTEVCREFLSAEEMSEQENLKENIFEYLTLLFSLSSEDSKETTEMLININMYIIKNAEYELWRIRQGPLKNDL